MTSSPPPPASPAPAREQRLLEAVLALETEGQRRAFLASLDDLDLRRRLEDLIAASAEADSFFGKAPEVHAGLEQPDHTVVLPASKAPAEAPAQVIGRYKLLEKVGEGGFGEVWMAEQREPVKRRVALKIIKLGMDSRQVVARFEAERQALAMMDHPNIARIFDADVTDSGRPYFVMELVRGIRITDYCDQHQLTTRERLDLFIKVCQAIQHAHQKGIIHRDIKPSNILVTLHDGVPVPKVIDFGIAKATQQELTDVTLFTQFQQFIGTPAYISPEQAEMSGLDIDTRADIYSLGVLLYELLVGQTPFDAREMMQGGLDALRQIIREREPQRPSTRLNTLQGDERTTAGKRRQTDVGKLIHQLHGDLDWIVMKCLEKDRTRRYETANGLAADIQRHLANEPVIARPPSAAYRFQKLVRRNKVMAAGVSLAAGFLVLGLAGATFSFLREQAARKRAQELERVSQLEAERARAAEQIATEQRQRATEEATNARRLLYGSEMGRAWDAYNAGDFATAAVFLNRQRPGARGSSIATNSPDFRGWEWRYLWDRTRSREILKLPAGGRVRSLSFHPAGHWLATVSHDNVIRLWDLQTRLELKSIAVPFIVHSIAYSPDGSRLASTGSGTSGWRAGAGLLAVWDGTSLEPVRTLATTNAGFRVAFSPNGKFLAGSVAHELKLWDTASWRELASWNTSPGQEATSQRKDRKTHVVSIAVSSDSRMVALSTMDGRIHLWNVEGNAPLASWQAYHSETSAGFGIAIALSPDGRSLASAAMMTRDIQTAVEGRVWDVATRQIRATFPVVHPQGTLDYLAYSPNGQTLAAGNRNGGLALFDTETWQLKHTFAGHEGSVRCVAFQPDGRRLASGSLDETIRVWDPANVSSNSSTHAMPKGVGKYLVSENGLHVGASFGDQSLSVWRLPEWQPVVVRMKPPLPGAHFSALAGDRPWAALADANGAIAIANLRTGQLERNWVVSGGPAVPLVFFEDSSAVLVRRADGRLDCWQLHPLRERWQKALPDSFWKDRCGIFVTSDSRRVILVGNAQPMVLDAATGKELHRLNPQVATDRLQGIAFAPNAPALALADTDRIELFSFTSAGTRTATIPFVGGARSLALTADGSRLVVGSADKLSFFDPATQQVIAELRTQAGMASEIVRFLPGGDALATGSYSGRVQIWRAPSWEEIAAAESKEKAADKGGTAHFAMSSAGDPRRADLAVRAAAVQLWSGQHAEYAATRQRMLAWAAGTTDATTAGRVAMLACLRPEPDALQREAVLALARKATEFMLGNPDEAWCQLALGMAEYRSARYAAADESLAVAAQLASTVDGADYQARIEGIANFFRAMSLYQQGKPAGAHALFTATEARMKPLPRDGHNVISANEHQDDVLLWLACKEAKTLLAEPGTGGK